VLEELASLTKGLIEVHVPGRSVETLNGIERVEGRAPIEGFVLELQDIGVGL
jgi:hypothetical protein